MHKLINLTPHTLDIYDEKKDYVIAQVPASGKVARVQVTRIKHEPIIPGGEGVIMPHNRVGCPIPLFETTFGAITGLPEPEADTYLIVSLLVKQTWDQSDMLKPREDLVSPGEAVRNPNGVVVGCIGLTL